MNAFSKVSLLVTLMCAVFVMCGEVLTAVSGGGGGVVVSGEVGPEQGEAIFHGKGKCYTCHSIGDEGSSVRCPNLGTFGDQFRQPVAVRAAERKKNEGYSAIRYIVESIYDPNAFVVPGYNKGLMTPIHRPPIGLSNDEIASVILYLLTKSGVEYGEAELAEIRMEQNVFSAFGAEEDAGPPAVDFGEGDAEEGFYAFAEMKCMQCHEVEGVNFEVEGEPPTGGVGPELSSIGSIQTREYLIESLVNPDAVIVADPPGVEFGESGSYRAEDRHSRMPEFHDTMTLRELVDIASFLKTLEGPVTNAERYP